MRQIPNSFSFAEKAKSKQEASIFQRWTPKGVGLEKERGKSHYAKNRMFSFLLSTFGFIAANNVLEDKSTGWFRKSLNVWVPEGKNQRKL